MSNEKKKGGKPKTGQSALETATAAMAESLASYATEPHLFTVYTVTEDVGLAKNGDYMLKIGGIDAFVDPRLLKKGKIVVKDIKVGTKVIVKTRSVTKKISGGRYSASIATDTEYLVVAAL